MTHRSSLCSTDFGTKLLNSIQSSLDDYFVVNASHSNAFT